MHTITQPCLQDRIKQIAGQEHMHTITQPCLQDRIKQIADQGQINISTLLNVYTHDQVIITLPTRLCRADQWSETFKNTILCIATFTFTVSVGRSSLIIHGLLGASIAEAADIPPIRQIQSIALA